MELGLSFQLLSPKSRPQPHLLIIFSLLASTVVLLPLLCIPPSAFAHVPHITLSVISRVFQDEEPFLDHPCFSSKLQPLRPAYVVTKAVELHVAPFLFNGTRLNL